MEKSLFERMGGTYTKAGNYLLPDLAPPESIPLGVWGQRRRRCLLEHRDGLYTGLLLSGKLDAHLAEIDRQAEEMFLRLVDRMAAQEGITEQLKVDDQMAWVGRMNNVRARAAEIVNADLIYS